ncbi:MAG TPA: hypothetical protein VFS21_33945 [Roseiflexaceae bacterium]|nr:hypothetical protein [Roseiflexaceae bacterium]
MRTVLRPPRFFRCTLLLCLLALLLSMVPVRNAQAAINKTLSVENSLGDFSRGSFLRSSLAAISSPLSTKIPDQLGAMQISPIGVIKNWRTSAVELPVPLQRLGTAVYGNRIYVIGGQTPNGQVFENTAKVWSNTVSTQDGAFAGDEWQAEPDLPALVSRREDTNTYAALSAPAVTLVDLPGAGGVYLYVIGGNVTVGTISFSSYAVRRATIDGNGRISAWTEVAELPGPADNQNFGKNGIEAASAVTYQVGGKTFIYLLGGQESFYTGTGGGGQTRVARPSRRVFYAEVGPNGNLYKPESNRQTVGWTQLTNASIPDLTDSGGADGSVGLLDATAVLSEFDTGDASKANSLFLIGGQRNVSQTSPTYSALVRQAQVSSDGTLQWTGVPMTMANPRSGMAGSVFRGSLYLTGGRIGNSPDPSKTIQTSVVANDLTLDSYGDNTNFLPSDTMPEERMWHGSQIVGNSSGTGFLYVMGGRGISQTGPGGEASAISREIFFAKLGADEDKSQGISRDARYYSAVYPIVFEGAEVKEINWTAAISTGTNMDVVVSYRTSNANNCSNPGWDESDWGPDLVSTEAATGNPDHNSTNGVNSFPITQSEIARCFQYRVTLVAGLTGQTATFSPSLFNLGIIVRVPGSPDLKVKPNSTSDPDAFKERRNQQGAFTGLNVKLINKNDQTQPPDNKTQDAAAEESGTFFADIYMYKPGEADVAPTLPPGSGGPEPIGCVQINKSLLPAEGEYAINQWFASDATCQNTPIDLRDIVVAGGKGKYVVYVVVDSACFGGANDYGCVNEKDALNGEGNNVSRLEFEITGEGPIVGNDDIYLPVIRRS